MKKFTIPALFLALLAAFFSGCSSNTGKIALAGLKVELTKIERAPDGTAEVSWQVVNPNISAYLLAKTRHRIYLDGTLVGTAENPNPMGIPAQKNIAKTTKLPLAGTAAEQALAAAAARGTASYRVESQITIQVNGDTTDSGNLSHTGTVSVTGK